MSSTTQAAPSTPAIPAIDPNVVEFCHYLDSEGWTTRQIIHALEHPDRYQPEWLTWLCRVNCEIDPTDTIEDCLQAWYAARAEEHAEGTRAWLELPRQDAVLDITAWEAANDDELVSGQKFRFSIKAKGLYAAGAWIVEATVGVEEKYGRRIASFDAEVID